MFLRHFLMLSETHLNGFLNLLFAPDLPLPQHQLSIHYFTDVLTQFYCKKRPQHHGKPPWSTTSSADQWGFFIRGAMSPPAAVCSWTLSARQQQWVSGVTESPPAWSETLHFHPCFHKQVGEMQPTAWVRRGSPVHVSITHPTAKWHRGFSFLGKARTGVREDLHSHLELVLQQQPALYHTQHTVQPYKDVCVDTQVTAGDGL